MKKQPKIAFCFLLYDKVKHEQLWKDFFNQDKENRYSIYSHVKSVNNKTPRWIKERTVKTVKTSWCSEKIILAFNQMLKEAMKDPDNKYFILVSGDCIPLYNFHTTYSKINRSEKARIEYTNKVNTCGNYEKYYFASQWVVLNRKIALLYIDMGKKENLKWSLKNYRRLRSPQCPDEVLPIEWLVHNLGKPSSENFKKYIKYQNVTFSYWRTNVDSPIIIYSTFAKNLKNSMCESGALFARKFSKPAAKIVGMKCK